MSCDLRLSVEKVADAFTITVSGDVDLSNSENLVTAARLALRHTPCAAVTLDLGGVTFIDCTGVNALLTIVHECKEQSALVALTNASVCVRRIADLV